MPNYWKAHLTYVVAASLFFCGCDEKKGPSQTSKDVDTEPPQTPKHVDTAAELFRDMQQKDESENFNLASFGKWANETASGMTAVASRELRTAGSDAEVKVISVDIKHSDSTLYPKVCEAVFETKVTMNGEVVLEQQSREQFVRQLGTWKKVRMWQKENS